MTIIQCKRNKTFIEFEAHLYNNLTSALLTEIQITTFFVAN